MLNHLVKNKLQLTELMSMEIIANLIVDGLRTKNRLTIVDHVQKIMEKREANFTVKLKIWLKYNMPNSFVGEVKYPIRKNYYFHSDKSFKKEMTSLLIAGHDFIYKFSDISRFGTPCDFVKLHQCPGYFFFTWDGKVFYAIEVSDMERYINEGNKFINEDGATTIGIRNVL